jgi:hypothetical protein
MGRHTTELRSLQRVRTRCLAESGAHLLFWHLVLDKGNPWRQQPSPQTVINGSLRKVTGRRCHSHHSWVRGGCLVAPGRFASV